MDIVAKRQEEADRILSGAAAERRAAGDARAEAEGARAELDAKKDLLISEAHKAAKAEEESLRARLSQEVAKLRAEAQVAIARDREAAQLAVLAHAEELALDIARRLVARLPPGPSLSVFVDGACGEIRGLPSVAKASFTSAVSDHPLEVVTAGALSEEEAAQLRHAVTQALGVEAPIVCRSDPALIAGIEIYGRGAIIRNNWRADLERIGEQLRRGDERNEF
jgi:F-type H+-transporting ATPase subunit b